jgi:predicted ATPase
MSPGAKAQRRRQPLTSAIGSGRDRAPESALVPPALSGPCAGCRLCKACATIIMHIPGNMARSAVRMIRLIEASRYRCLRRIKRRLEPFQILVGPNASGKSTFLDVIAFLRDFVHDGPMQAIRLRSPSLTNLLWMGEGQRFELAVELPIPPERRSRLPQNGYARARYEAAVGLDDKDELSILGEALWLKPEDANEAPLPLLFPSMDEPPEPVMLPEGRKSPKGWKKIVSKSASGIDYFFSETSGWNNPFRLGPQRSALANLPEDEERFPVAVWVKRVLMEGVQRLVLNSEAMRRPAPPASPREFQPDGSNLPWAIEALAPQAYEDWLAHIRTALPDVKTIETFERPEDKYRYLQIVYANGLKAPSWTVSDGTLRLLALTLLAYIESPERIYLIEEPENGIHPQAVETVFQSLSSAYDRQILCASHSPVLLSLAEPQQILCFGRNADGATDIVSGDRHPNLADWRRGADLGTLFATGVLG